MSGFEAWAGRALVAGGLVLLAGWLAVKLCRGAARRQAAAAWAVRGAVLAAVVAAFPGWLPVTLPTPPLEPVEAAAASVEPEETEWLLVPDDEGGPEEAPAEPLAAEAPSNPVPPGWPAERYLVVGYGLVAAGLFAHLLLGHLALVRLTRRASPAPPRVRARYPGRVFVADGLASPVCFGLLRPTVLLPRGLSESASATELGWVLAHEHDHVARGDHRSAWWAGLARCAFFPLPWFWAVRRELVLAQEYLADAAAADGRAAEYAAFLVKLSAPPVRLPLVAAGVRAGKSDLFRRVTMLLNDGTEPRRASRGWRLLVGAVAVGGAATLGGLTVQQAAADEPKPGRPIRIELRVDDDKKAEGEKKPDGDKKVQEKKRTVVVQATNAKEVAELKDKIKAAAKKGNADEVAELVEKLEKALRAMPKVQDFNANVKRTGPEAMWLGEDGQPRVWSFSPNGIDEAVKQLQARLEAMKDNPEAKAAIEAALTSLKAQGNGRSAPYGWKIVPAPADPFTPKARFGVAVDAVPEAVREQLDVGEKVGLLAADVRPDTPAAKAGLKKGDVLTKFGDKDVASDPTKFVEQVRAAKAGKVDVVVIRKGKTQTLSVELPEAAKPTERPKADRAAEGERRDADAARRTKDQARRAAEQDARKGGNDFSTISLFVGPDKFKAEASNAGVDYTVAGKLTDGKPAVESVKVKDGETVHEGKAVADVPQQYRGKLNRLVFLATPANAR